jgi:SAM-dependent methyltransferase
MARQQDGRANMSETPCEADSGGYDPQFFARIAAVEDRHFWFRARNRVIAAAVGSLVRILSPGYRVLEVGCGTGGVLRMLSEVCQTGEVIGCDLYPEAVEFARKKSGCCVHTDDIMNPSKDMGRFDLVCFFDVLEHLPDESQTLKALRSFLKADGRLIVTVPAHSSLWSYFDVAACHCRRYEPEQLIQVLQENGFEIEYQTEFMSLLFPIIWTSRRMAGIGLPGSRATAANKAASELKVVPVLNDILKMVLAWEPSLIRRRMKLPIGSSLLAIASKS